DRYVQCGGCATMCRRHIFRASEEPGVKQWSPLHAVLIEKWCLVPGGRGCMKLPTVLASRLPTGGGRQAMGGEPGLGLPAEDVKSSGSQGHCQLSVVRITQKNLLGNVLVQSRADGETSESGVDSEEEEGRVNEDRLVTAVDDWHHSKPTPGADTLHYPTSQAFYQNQYKDRERVCEPLKDHIQSFKLLNHEIPAPRGDGGVESDTSALDGRRPVPRAANGAWQKDNATAAATTT
ncbi:hypothetical protein KUCAC02_024443, partial [Chaenocephalus aceratus]